MPSIAPGEDDGTGGVVMCTSITVRHSTLYMTRPDLALTIATVDEHVVGEESPSWSWQLGTGLM
jgi:hypothetical protein